MDSNNRSCFLCFANEDSVFGQKLQEVGDDEVLLQVFDYIFGLNASQNDYICIECQTNTTQTYIFMQKIKLLHQEVGSTETLDRNKEETSESNYEKEEGETSASEDGESDGENTSGNNLPKKRGPKPRNNSQEMDFKCYECSKSFDSYYLLTNHFKYHHLKIFDHVCKVCDKAYHNKFRLNKHKCKGNKSK